MKRIISLLLALTLTVGSMAVLSSCGKGDGEDLGAEIAVYLGDEVYDLDPGDYFVSDNAAQFMSLLYEPLFKLDEDGDLKMAAAEDYEVDEEEREITITLRESYWSDGNRVVPGDFVYAWERLLNPANQNPAAALLFDIEGALEVKNGESSSLYDAAFNNKGDGETIIINYREGADVDALLANLASIATAPVRQSVVESNEGFWSKSVVSIVTNGPFSLAGYNVEEYGSDVDPEDIEDRKITLERNVGYHQPRDSKKADKQVKPYQIVSFWDAEGRELKLTYEDITAKTVFFLADATEEGRKNATFAKEADAYDTLSTFTFAFISDNEIFADVNLRKAMSMALDREAIAKALVYAKAATGFLPGTVLGVNGKAFAPTSKITTTAQLQAAQALVPAAAKSVTIRVALGDDADSVIIGNLVKKAWTDLGLTVEVNNLGAKASEVFNVGVGAKEVKYDSYVQYLVKTAVEGSTPANAEDVYDVVGFDWQMYSASPIVGLSSLSGNMNGNGVKVSYGDKGAINREILPSLAVWTAAKQTSYDKLLDEAYKAKTAADREAKLLAAANLIVEDVPVIPVVFNRSVAVIGDGLSRVEVDYFGNFSFTRAKLKNYEDYLINKEAE